MCDEIADDGHNDGYENIEDDGNGEDEELSMCELGERLVILLTSVLYYVADTFDYGPGSLRGIRESWGFFLAHMV